MRACTYIITSFAEHGVGCKKNKRYDAECREKKLDGKPDSHVANVRTKSYGYQVYTGTVYRLKSSPITRAVGPWLTRCDVYDEGHGSIVGYGMCVYHVFFLLCSHMTTTCQIEFESSELFKQYTAHI